MLSRHAFTSRLLAHWRVKLMLGAVLMIYFCVCYFGLQHIHLFQPHTFAPSRVDEWVAFEPAWTIVYQSMYLMLPAAWLCETLDQLRRYTVGFVLFSVIGFICFLFFPVIGPRPAGGASGLLGVIQSYDSPLKTFPSLHVALTMYSACFIAHVVGASRRLVTILVMWTALIAYSTLATKQHYFVDVPAGAILGWLGHVAAGITRPTAIISVEGSAA